MGQSVEGAARFTRHVDDLWGRRESLPVLIENRDAVERLLALPGFTIVASVLDAEIATLDRKLEGRALEQAEYARLLGQRASMRAFSEAAQSVIDRANENEARARAESAGGESSAGG